MPPHQVPEPLTETPALRAGRPAGRRMALPVDRPRTGPTRREMKTQQGHRPDEAQGDARQPLSPSARTMTPSRRRSMWPAETGPVNRRARLRWRPEMTNRQPGPPMKAARTARTRVVRIVRTLPATRAGKATVRPTRADRADRADRATVRPTRADRVTVRPTRAGRPTVRPTRADRADRVGRATVRPTRVGRATRAGATTTPAIGATIAAVVAATVQVRAPSATSKGQAAIKSSHTRERPSRRGARSPSATRATDSSDATGTSLPSRTCMYPSARRGVFA